MTTATQRIVVAMSGGVDSSVAAALLAAQGHDVVGMSMQLYDQREDGPAFGSCCSLDDLYDARAVAGRLGIPHYILNFEREFEETVVRDFVESYTRGRTPLPCARCNTDLKFTALLDRARGLGADVVATGHYARLTVDAQTGRVALCRGRDRAKDQSYFLFGLTQEQLRRACFPIGELDKDAVRGHARQLGLRVADKPDSQELCFVPSGGHAEFISARAQQAPEPGSIVTRDGRTLGRHEGIHHFTVGQRKGLRLAASVPLYVLGVDATRNEIVVGPRAALERDSLTASDVNWIAGSPPTGLLRVYAQIRHQHRPAAASVTPLAGGRAGVRFDAPQSAIAPGQAVVFYRDDEVVGGGWID
jgi:tRNA-specific 2-thiouridylase